MDKPRNSVGPLNREEVPRPDIIVNYLMVHIEPNLSAIIIVNMSSLKTKVGPGAVNLGIDRGEFEAHMSSTSKFVESLAEAGVGALKCKSDWSSAYKHQHVCKEDLKLHFIEFEGMLFCELILVFGAIFSTGIYDDLAKEVLGCAIFLSDMDEDLVQQHLDDETAGDGLIFTFNEAYRYV